MTQPSPPSSFITGGSGLLGGALRKIVPNAYAPTRHEFDLAAPPSIFGIDIAFLCAGTKGYAECEGNRAVFRSDVDGNIRLARHLLSEGAFVVFVSTDAVEWALHTAYARNRFMVELAIGGLPNVAIFRPSKFDASTVTDVAVSCVRIGLDRIAGLTRWP